ncbi:MAG: AMP-binding protein [Deltaproteobacteria bacterium]|nr:AMP-binding protein [Deltaproteobacteria bacterium]
MVDVEVNQVDGQHHHLPAGVAYDPAAAGLGTLPRSWARHFDAAPERTCLLDAAGAALCYGDLDRATRAAAGRLHASGLRRGDRVLCSAAASPGLVIAHVACLRLGLVVIPTNTAYRREEIMHVVRDARPAAAIVDASACSEAVRAADASVQVFAPAIDAPTADAPALDETEPSAPALIGYTSGTTGRPKGAVLSHANLLASVEALRLAWRWSADDRLVLALPLFHMHGLGVGLHGTLHAGASAILLPRFDPDAVFDAIDAHGATLFFGVPTMYRRLVDATRARELARLRLCVSGSAPLPADLHRRFEAATGQRIVERYGMTETAMLVSNPVDGERRPGTVGLPLPGVEVRLAGRPAQIEVRGANVFAGYFERDDATAEAFAEAGWFRTGDLGELDEAGYLVISGRVKELIISGGYNVYPREVEDALRLHPAIEDAAVVGTASEEWGEVVTAYVVASEEIEADGLRGFLDDHIAAYKHPRRLHRIDALPRNALGKVQKHRLAHGRVLGEET